MPRTLIALSQAAAHRKLRRAPGWVVRPRRLSRELRFRDFRHAMRFVNRVARVAEKIGHHPDITIHGYRHVRIETHTHATGGLSSYDIGLALAVEKLLKP